MVEVLSEAKAAVVVEVVIE